MAWCKSGGEAGTSQEGIRLGCRDKGGGGGGGDGGGNQEIRQPHGRKRRTFSPTNAPPRINAT